MIYISLEDTRFDYIGCLLDKIVYSIIDVDWLRYFRRNFHFSIVNYVLVLCPILYVTIHKLMNSVNITIEPNNKWRCYWCISNFMRNNRIFFISDEYFSDGIVTPCWSDNNPFVRSTTVDDYWIVKMNEFSWHPEFRNTFVNEHIDSLKMHATLHCHHRFSAGELWHSLPTNHQFTINASWKHGENVNSSGNRINLTERRIAMCRGSAKITTCQVPMIFFIIDNALHPKRHENVCSAEVTVERLCFIFHRIARFDSTDNNFASINGHSASATLHCRSYNSHCTSSTIYSQACDSNWKIIFFFICRIEHFSIWNFRAFVSF